MNVRGDFKARGDDIRGTFRAFAPAALRKPHPYRSFFVRLTDDKAFVIRPCGGLRKRKYKLEKIHRDKLVGHEKPLRLFARRRTVYQIVFFHAVLLPVHLCFISYDVY